MLEPWQSARQWQRKERKKGDKISLVPVHFGLYMLMAAVSEYSAQLGRCIRTGWLFSLRKALQDSLKVLGLVFFLSLELIPKLESGAELSAFSVDRQGPVVVLCCSAPHLAPSSLLLWFCHH